MISDFDLLDRYENGDQEAIEEIVSRYQKPVFFYILRVVWNETDAADLLQKTFINAFRNIRRFNRRSNLKTWLYRIAMNVCKNHFRDNPRRREINLEGMILSDRKNPLDHIISKEERIRLSVALNDLPEKQRHTVILKVYHGLRYREIAQITGSSEGAAKANFHYGVKKLKVILGG